MNEKIINRIKEARIEKDRTQKELGDLLGKSAASISELERGNVQVNATDLYQIAKYLNKPIDYFYGEDQDEKEFEDLIIILRKQSPEAMSQSKEIISLINQMQEVSDKLQKNQDEKPSVKDIRKFLNAFIGYKEYLNILNIKFEELTKKFLTELKKQGIEL